LRPFKKVLLVYAAAVAVALSLTASAGAQTGLTEKLKTIKLDNFGRISDTFYRGSQPKDHDYSDLAAFGIKTVINLTSDDAQANEKTMVESAGMKYCSIPMTTHEPPTTTKMAEFLNIVNDPANQPIYVHCVGGKHRTGVMTAIYRMTHDSWTADQAFKEMKQYKFGADFLHSEFKKFVFDFYSQLVSQAKAHTVPLQQAVADGTATTPQ
jgi:tyrosine-protein phosphatase SIW14